MATKKKSSKKAKAGHKAAAKKPAAKKAAGKKAAKQAAPKRQAPKKRAAPKKQAKQPTPKQAAPKKAAKTTEVGAAAPIADAPAWASAFPPVLQSLVDWVNGGKLGGVDFEMYQGFNEQYKPSDWTRNPATDAELFTFGMDGTGGQVAIWRNDAAADFDALPIVFLGSEGEVHPLATSLPQFLHELAHGLGPLELTSGGEVNANDEMLAWVKVTYPQAELGDPLEIFNAAKQTLAAFEQHLSAQTQT